MEFLSHLENYLKKRKIELPENSYTADLFRSGLDRILKKVGEEAGEFIIASKNNDKEELIHESADLIFHFMMALQEKGVSLDEVIEELKKRHS